MAGIACLPDRWLDNNSFEFQFENDAGYVAVRVAQLDMMEPFYLNPTISVAIVCSPSPARRLTHVRTRKCAPTSWLRQ